MPTLAQSIAPAWFVLPVAAVALLVTAGHWIALARAEMPAGRKRLRTANGLVMMMTIPVLAYGFGAVDTADHRRFVLTWMAASGLIIIVVTLAALDLCSTFLFAHQARRQLLADFAASRAKAAHEARVAAAGGAVQIAAPPVANRPEGANPPDA
ncbi:MAG TPA: hypothetical protein VHN77_01525 [Phycisphaerales bacterium]|nr:hypothetical protein [Phycisphaerales bacterium]